MSERRVRGGEELAAPHCPSVDVLGGRGASGEWAEESCFKEEVHENQVNVAAAMVRDEKLYEAGG